MDIRVLGTGCTKCKKLYDETQKALETTGVQADLSKVEDINDIIEYGVMMTPALVIDGQVMSSGKLPKAAKLQEMILKAAKTSE
jgi:small redox-active disulfide protein 2